MSFVPAIPASGLLGLRVLDQTFDRQVERFAARPEIARDAADFVERAGTLTSAAELVADRALLNVALSAFGLEEELPKRALIRKVLEDGADNPQGLATRLVDPAWKRFARAFDFSAGPPMATLEARRTITQAFEVRQFERAVGELDVDLRLALNFRREIELLVQEEGTDQSKWFRAIGSRPLRTVLFGALGVPESAGALDVDLLADRLQDRSQSVFASSSLSVFSSPDEVEKAVRLFLQRRSIESVPTSGGNTALQLLGAPAVSAPTISGLLEAFVQS
ncbi:MAG: DUF1217 domain-containing protein [Pseudomonadota bacterium]